MMSVMWSEEQKNGKVKFVERYEDFLTGKTKKVSITMDKNTAATRKQALNILNAKIDKALQKNHKKEITLKDLVEEYRKYQKMSVKKSTYTRNYYICTTLMCILGEFMLVKNLTARYVKIKLIETGKDAGTLNEYLTRFKALIRWGYKNDFIEDISFLDKIERFKDRSHREKIQDKFLESDDVKILLDAMTVPIWKLLTEFLVLSGLRFGETAALLQSDVDLKNNVIHVNKTYDVINKETTTPKTLCSIRDIHMQEELKNVCLEIKREMLIQRELNQYNSQNLFFEDKTGQHVNYYLYNKYLKENSFKTLGRTITAHALRHTHASLLLEQGIGIDTISRRLGHENSKITREIYLHVTERLKEKDNEQIARVQIL